ncbi:S8 family serine peptidase [bacterium]|nr:S8 family serine peptidase [candidate division CSSED10-310 bacterium]
MMRNALMVIVCMFLWLPVSFARIGDEPVLGSMEPGIDYAPGEILVKLVPELRHLSSAQVLSEYRLGLLSEHPRLGWDLLAVPEEVPDSVARMVAALSEDSRVQAVTPNYYRFLEWEPDDWYWTHDHLWNFRILGLPDAWDKDTSPPLYGGDPDVVVAVIDSGATYKTWDDSEHYTDEYGNPVTVQFGQAPDFENLQYWINEDEVPGNGMDDDSNGYIDDSEGWNFVFDSPFPSDDKGHGSHVSGTICQSTNNDSGSAVETLRSAAGMAFECTLMILKTANQTGVSSMADVAEAIEYAANNGAHVVNMSLGSGYVGQGASDTIEKDACDYAYANGVVVVSSSGNDADESFWNPETYGVGYPAGYASVIAVGASNNATTLGDPLTESRTSFSQYGYTSEVIAPSGHWDFGDADGSGKTDDVWQSTVKAAKFPDMTQFAIRGNNGTSMASPHVAALAGLILSYGNQTGQTFSPMDVRNRINAAAVDINADEMPGYDYVIGFGRIHAADAIDFEPEPEMVVSKALVFEAPGQGNGNMRAEAGETVSLSVDLMSLFAGATGIQATVTSGSPYLTMGTNTLTYNNASANEPTSSIGNFTLSIAGNCPLQYDAEFHIAIDFNESPTTVTQVFHTRLTRARLLFWDDDRGQGKSNAHEAPVLAALEQAGIAYEYWDTLPRESAAKTEQFIYPWQEFNFVQMPTFEDLKPYDALIWFMGESGQGRKEIIMDFLPGLIDYMDAGGNVMITSHELLFKLHRYPTGEDDLCWVDKTADPDPDNPDPDNLAEYADYFIYNYLHIEGIEHDDWYEEVHGGAADPLTRGMSKSMDPETYNMPFAHNYNWWPDALVPCEDAVVTFTAGDPVRPGDEYAYDPNDMQKSFDEDLPFKAKNNPCGIRYPGAGGSSPYRMIFLAFPLEAMSGMVEVVQPLVGWLLDGTGEASSQMLVDIETSLALYTYNDTAAEPAGDPFSVYGMVYNPGSPISAQRWVLLEIYGFYFWPDWSVAVDYADRNIQSGFSTENFLAFEWPQGNFGSFDGIRFWMAHLSQDMNLLGEFDYCEWGYY